MSETKILPEVVRTSDTKVSPGGAAIPDVFMVTADQETIIGNGTTGDPLRVNADVAGGVDLDDDGAPVDGNPHRTLNFVGSGVTVTDVGGGVATITIPGGGTGIDVEDEGVPVGTFGIVNFTGAGVTVTDGGGVAQIAIPGGVTLEDEGSGVTGNPHGTLNFVGAGVTVTDVAGVGTITIPGGISGIGVREEGSSLGSFTALNLVGAGATATDAGGGVAQIAIPGGVTLEDEGSGVTGNPHGTLNFVGAGVTVTDVAGVGTITIPGGISGLVVQDEGSPLAGGPFTTMNFVGGVVTASNVGGVATVTITGGTPMFDTVLTPAAITFGAAFDNWNPGVLGQNTLIRCTTDGSTRSVRGLVGGVDGKVVQLLNVNASPSVGESWVAEDPAATAANRFRTAFSSGGCFYIYDGGLTRWCLMSGTP